MIAENDYSHGKAPFLRLPNQFKERGGKVTRHLFSSTLKWALDQTPTNNVVILLADYLLYDVVDIALLQRCADYLSANVDLLRIDIGDRPRPGTMRNVNDFIIECANSRDCFLPTSLTPGT